MDWSKVTPHLPGYYSKIHGADGGATTPTPDERRGDSRRCTTNSNSASKSCCIINNIRRQTKWPTTDRRYRRRRCPPSTQQSLRGSSRRWNAMSGRRAAWVRRRRPRPRRGGSARSSLWLPQPRGGRQKNGKRRPLKLVQCSSSSAAAAAAGDGNAIRRGNGDGTPTVRGAGGGRGPEPVAPQQTGGGGWEEATRVSIGECVDQGGVASFDGDTGRQSGSRGEGGGGREQTAILRGMYQGKKACQCN